jgi:hypothetical protein
VQNVNRNEIEFSILTIFPDRLLQSVQTHIVIYPVASLETATRSCEQAYYQIEENRLVDASVVNGLPAYSSGSCFQCRLCLAALWAAAEPPGCRTRGATASGLLQIVSIEC